MDYSVVIPVYNEEESLPPLFNELKNVLDSLGASYEIIFVDDGSSDSTPNILNELKNLHSNIIKIVTIDARKGQTHALKKGLQAVDGSVAFTLDADLQNDPHDIPKMIKKLDEGYDCVCGWRKARQDKMLKAILSKFGNVLQRLLTGMTIHDVSCTLRAYRKECIRHVDLDWEGQHRFIPLSLTLNGCSVGEIISNHRKRQFGCTKYSHKRIFQVMVDFFRILKVKRSV